MNLKLLFGAAALPILLFLVPVTGSAGGHTTPLLDIQDRAGSLAEYLGKGKWVVFNIWGPKCPPCLEEVSELVSFHEDHREHDAIVVSMALDFPSFGWANKEQVANFVEDYFITFPVFLGDSRLSEQVTGKRLMGTPTSYLYDPQGRLAAVQIGGITRDRIEQLIRFYQAG